jgi:hypothetical protein
VKNENYRIDGQPYFNEVRIVNFPSDAARSTRAVRAGRGDGDVPFAQVP